MERCVRGFLTGVGGFPGFVEESFDARQRDEEARQQSIEKFEFKLKELDARVLADLESILTEDQWTQIGQGK